MNCYRFRDSVAISGEYMSPKEARRLARQLNALARDIQSKGVWGDKTPPSIEIETFKTYSDFRKD